MEESGDLSVFKEVYTKRLQNLHQAVDRAMKEVETDEVLQVMKNDPITLKYVLQRKREIYKNKLLVEKEGTIKELIEEVAFLTQENSKLKEDVKNCYSFIESMKQNYISLKESKDREYAWTLHEAREEVLKKENNYKAEINRLTAKLERKKQTIKELIDKKEIEDQQILITLENLEQDFCSKIIQFQHQHTLQAQAIQKFYQHRLDDSVLLETQQGTLHKNPSFREENSGIQERLQSDKDQEQKTNIYN